MPRWHNTLSRFFRPAASPPAFRASGAWPQSLPEPIDLTRPPALSFRHAGRSPVFRLIAPLLIRLLIVTPLPPSMQVYAALFPVSVLWPLVASREEAPRAAPSEAVAAREVASLSDAPAERASAWDTGHECFGWQERLSLGSRPVGSRDTFTCTAAAAGPVSCLGRGRETRYSVHATTGDLLSMTDALGNKTGYGYDEHGRLTAITDPRGHVTTQSNHDSFGSAGRVTDPVGLVTQRGFDNLGRMISEQELGRRLTTFVYDGFDRVAQQTRYALFPGSENEVTKTEYYAGGQPRIVTNAKGAATTYTLDGLDRVVKTETKVGTQVLTTATEYDGNGNKVLEKDRRGVTRRFTYDALNRLERVQIVGGLAGEGPLGQVAAYTYDLVGNKLTETNVAGLTTSFVHDGLYRLKEKVLPEGPATGQRYREIYGYDKVGNRTSVTDANGNTTQVVYDKLNRAVLETNALGQVRTTSYNDPEGSHVNKSEEHDVTRGLRTAYLYGADNRETERKAFLQGAGGSGEVYTTSTRYPIDANQVIVKDPRGFVTTTWLDGFGRPALTILDSPWIETQIAYDGLGNRKKVIDPRGKETSFEYDGLGRLVKTTDALGKETLATYDGEGLKLSETDRRGIVRTFTYDNLGRLRTTRVIPSITGVGWSQEIRYDDLGRKRTETDARGKTAVYQLDGLDRVVKVTDPLGRTIVTAWDGVNKRSETNKRGHTTRFDYDRINRLTKTTDPAPFDAQTVETTYQDPLNRRVDKDRRGILTTTQTDPLGRVLTVARAGVTLETNAYDGNGNKTSAKDAEGKETQFAYDGANRLTARTEGLGTPEAATTTFRLDKNGNVEEERDARAVVLYPSFSVKKTYDDLNRVSSVMDAEGNTMAYGYDAEGSRILVREPEGQETAFAYDELGKLIRVTQPATEAGQAPVTVYQYDENRSRIRQTDGKGNVVLMGYDELNRMTSLTQDPASLNLITLHKYDENGNETELTDPKGQKVASGYDELNRLKSKTYLGTDTASLWRHTTAIGYTHDPNGNLTRADESVASGTDPPQVLTTARTYDDLDRAIQDTTPLPDGGTRTLRYGYYANGTRKTVTDPAGLVTQYTYDGQNRLATATTAFGTTGAKATTYAYFPDDLLKTVTYPNGVVATHGYDKADRLTSLANAKGTATVSSYTYTYDKNGNRLTQVEVNGGKTETTAYTYDPLNRLKTVTYPVDSAFPSGRVVSYGYDAVGNRLRETERTTAGAFLADKQGVFDNVNRLTALNDLLTPASSTTFTWDRNGNQTSKTTGGVTTTNLYDVRDKLVEVQQGAGIPGRFQYDFEGRRSKKIGLEGIRQYVYDQTSTFLELDENGVQKAKYDYGSDRLVSLTRADEGRRFYSFDGLGSVTSLTDDAGTAVASYHLDPWGNFRFPAELSSSKNRFGFTGYLFDSETNLYFAKARFYDPEVGRFTTADSFLGNIDDPPSLHRFVYGHNRPTFYIDPSGHEVKAVGVDTTRITWDEFGHPRVGAVVAVETETVEVRAYPDRASAVAAELDVNLAQPMNRLATRGMGGVRVVGGGVQVAVGAAGLAAPEPTMVTKVAGGIAIAHGIDDIQAGVRQATSGVVVETLTGTAIRKGAEKAGASPETAALISAGGEFVIAAGSTGLAARGIPAPQRTTLGRVEAEAPSAAANSRTFITYELKNAKGEVVYVGRASGVGTPEQVMQGRLARGHDVFDSNPGLRAEVKAVQGSPAANKGAEGVRYEQRLREGTRLLNDPKSPPLSSKPSKAAEVRAKVDAYHEDLKQP